MTKFIKIFKPTQGILTNIHFQGNITVCLIYIHLWIYSQKREYTNFYIQIIPSKECGSHFLTLTSLIRYTFERSFNQNPSRQLTEVGVLFLRVIYV